MLAKLEVENVFFEILARFMYTHKDNILKFLRTSTQKPLVFPARGLG